MGNKLKKDLKADYLYGIKMGASIIVAVIYFMILGALMFTLPIWVMFDVFPRILSFYYYFFIVIPSGLLISGFLGYNWWWLCKNVIQHRLGSWLLIEL